MSKKTKFEPRVYVPFVSVSPNQIHFYSRPIDGYSYSSRFQQNKEWLQDNSHEGIISYKAGKKIARAIIWLIFKSKPQRAVDQLTGKSYTFRINFVTLTLPSKQQHSDQEIKDRCLNNFLQILRSQGVADYLWRAEAQPGTGNIHFHITTNKYLPHDKVRKWWNSSVEKLGYIENFELKHKHRNPNSTDVHSVKHIKNLTAYLSKYMGKNKAFPCIGELRLYDGQVQEVLYGTDQYRKEEPNRKKGKLVGHVLGAQIRKIEGRLWGCSSSLSKIKNFRVNGEEFNVSVYQDFVQQSGFRKVQSQWVDSYYGNIATEAKTWFPHLYSKLQECSRTEVLAQ